MILYSGLSFTREDLAKKQTFFNSTVGRRITLAPPIKRGDLYRAFDAGERVFLIADGEFEQNLAVTVGEIADALRGGALVFGSSSMGAMRAAELADFGMKGVGEIFHMIVSSPTFRDDWLGHLYDQETLEIQTLPFIELLFLLKEAGLPVTEDFGLRLQDKLDIRFDGLTIETCERIVDKVAKDSAADIKKRLSKIFAGKSFSQKRRDAHSMFEACRQELVRNRKITLRLAASRQPKP